VTCDNSKDNLLYSHIATSATFVKSAPQGFTAAEITQMDGDDSLVILLKNGRLYRTGEGWISVPYEVTSFFVGPSGVYVVDVDHQVHDVRENTVLFQSERAVYFCASSTIQAIITRDRRCLAIIDGGISTIAEGAVAIGCTGISVFVATAAGVLEHRSGRTVGVEEPIVAISCNDDDGYFLGKSGKLFKYFEGNLLRVTGLPPVVAISVGIQHCGAIGGDGRLFVWGFNPSGQLGTGNDRIVVYPICVLENVCQVVCGVHNTWALVGPSLPNLPVGIDESILKGPIEPTRLRTDIPFAERLNIET
jgi:hypothetical protein